MKRLNEKYTSVSNKKPRNFTTILNKELPTLPPEMWNNIAHLLTLPDCLKLLSTSSVFAKNLQERFFLDCIQDNIFDYSHVSELNNFIKTPIDRSGFYSLMNQFVNKLGKAMLTIEKISSDSQIKIQYHIDDLLPILCTAAKEGNLLIIKAFNKHQSYFMEFFSNEADKNEMTPFGYAASYDREGICYELLSHYEDPFNSTISYDLGNGFAFSMTALHILGLRSNKMCLLNIFNEYRNTLESVFEENFEEALLYILKNRPERLKKLLEDETLLTTTDKASWNLLQWASCFPKAIDCLNLLIEKGMKSNKSSPSAIYIACAAGNLPALKTLVESGVKIEPFMNGSNCLHLTVFHGHSACTEYLIKECKQDVNLMNEKNDTPLSLGKLTHHDGIQLSKEQLEKKEACVKILLQNGAVEDMTLLQKSNW